MQNNLPSVQRFYLLHEGEGIHSTEMISEGMNVSFSNRRQKSIYLLHEIAKAANVDPN
jgi:hypothetical protein